MPPIDVSKYVTLKEFYCTQNQLTSLDVSKNTALTTLDCANNQLTHLDVSNNTSLIVLDCSSNQLTSLDVYINTALASLLCANNQLTSLDVSKNIALTNLSCENNQLMCLDTSTCTELGTDYISPTVSAFWRNKSYLEILLCSLQCVILSAKIHISGGKTKYIWIFHFLLVTFHFPSSSCILYPCQQFLVVLNAFKCLFGGILVTLFLAVSVTRTT